MKDYEGFVSTEAEIKKHNGKIAPLPRIPVATYRVQFNRGFTFADVARVTDYLHELGISDCYASPVFKACAESTHGYDICAFDQLNPNLGDEKDFNDFTEKLRSLGMGLVFDMVPNHMGSDASNRWWADVLTQGRASPFASFFDIDWKGDNADPSEKILVPILEDHYTQVLEAGKINVRFESEQFVIAYYDHRFTLSPETQKSLSEQSGNSTDGIKTFLNTLNGEAGCPKSFDTLDLILRAQHFRLAHWKVGPEEINYRHFFDIPELVSLRMESPKVFEETHKFLFQLLRDGKVTGLRIDHPDGLGDPQGYFRRLQETFLSQTGDGKPLFLVIEKILSGDELLPCDWPVDGTTGYDFLNRLNGIFVRRENKNIFDNIYREFTGVEIDFPTAVYAGNKKILRIALVSEWHALTRRLKRIAASTRYGWDFTYDQLHAALAEVIATFPVYRTYVRGDTTALTPQDRRAVEQAVVEAKSRNPKSDHVILDFIKKILSLEPFEDFDETTKKRAREFVIKFQQVSGPAMAKGLEDTAFYRFHRLISINEVGGNAETFGQTIDEFHRFNQIKAAHWPNSLLATATHDTKRGEDVRARLNVLSELPDDWHFAAMRWRQLNADKKTLVNEKVAPDANDEYLLYQTLAGAWPFEMDAPDALKIFRERISAYMLKAIREAKVNTSWTEQMPDYENAVRKFVEELLTDGMNQFLDDFKKFHRKIAFFGVFNSLSQLFLKLTSPGVPDFYQGTELWDLNLVDPDNRRPVDYESRRRMLGSLRNMPPSWKQLLEQSRTGQIKLFAMHRILEFRNKHRELFEHGDYVSLEVEGERKENVCAFARVLKKDRMIVVAPRFTYSLMNGIEKSPVGPAWNQARLHLQNSKPAERLLNVLTGAEIEVVNGLAELSDIFSEAPIALLYHV